MTGLPILIVQSPRSLERDTELGQQPPPQSSALYPDISPPPSPPSSPSSPPSSPFPFLFPGTLVAIAIPFTIYSLSNTCTTMCVFHYPVTKVCRLFFNFFNHSLLAFRLSNLLPETAPTKWVIQPRSPSLLPDLVVMLNTYC